MFSIFDIKETPDDNNFIVYYMLSSVINVVVRDYLK